MFEKKKGIKILCLLCVKSLLGISDREKKDVHFYCSFHKLYLELWREKLDVVNYIFVYVQSFWYVYSEFRNRHSKRWFIHEAQSYFSPFFDFVPYHFLRFLKLYALLLHSVYMKHFD